jgi:hypothetical protein
MLETEVSKILEPFQMYVSLLQQLHQEKEQQQLQLQQPYGD